MSFFNNTIYSILNKVFNVGFTFLTLVVIARVLEPAGQGKYSFLIQISRTFYYFFSFGFPVAFSFYFGRLREDRGNLIKTYFYVYLALAIIAGIAGLIFSYWGFEEFFSGISLSTGYLAVLGIPLWFINDYFLTIFLSTENFKQLYFNQIVQPFILLLGVVFCYLTDCLSVVNAIWSYIISMVVSTLFSIYHLNKGHFKFNFFKSSFKKELLVGSAKYAFKTYIGNVAEFLIYRSDVYIIAYFLPKSALGLYVIAVNIAERLWMISEAVSKVLFAKLVNVKEEKDKNYFTVYTLQGTFLMSIAAALGLLLFGKIFVDIFFGDDYSESVIYIYILLPGIILQSTALMIKKVLSARGYPGANAVSSIGCLLLNVVLNIVLIPQMGVSGAAIASSISYVAYFAVQAHSLNSKFGIGIREYVFISFREMKFLVNDLILKKIKK